MSKAKVVEEYRGVQILTDGTIYYVPDGLGDFNFFRSLDEARYSIEGGEE